MNVIEQVWLVLLYSYVALGIGFYLSKGLSDHFEKNEPVPIIGIAESITTSIDKLFEETGIKRLD